MEEAKRRRKIAECSSSSLVSSVVYIFFTRFECSFQALNEQAKKALKKKEAYNIGLSGRDLFTFDPSLFVNGDGENYTRNE